MTDAVTTDEVDEGDHACLTFTDPEERLDLVAAFVRDGLRTGLKVLRYTDTLNPDTLVGQLAARAVRPKAALRRGQLVVAPASTALGADGAVTASAMVKTLAGQLAAAGRDGYRGVRVTADMAWATRPSAPAEELVAFETEGAALFDDGRLCLICQYDRDRFDAVTLAFAARCHPKTVAAQVYHEHPLLRICRQYSPPGLRIAGTSLDFRHRDILEQALAETLRLDRNPHLNLTRLDYIDGACAAQIVTAGARLPTSRHITLTCRQAVATVLGLVGANAAPRLRVQASP